MHFLDPDGQFLADLLRRDPFTEKNAFLTINLKKNIFRTSKCIFYQNPLVYTQKCYQNKAIYCFLAPFLAFFGKKWRFSTKISKNFKTVFFYAFPQFLEFSAINLQKTSLGDLSKKWCGNFCDFEFLPPFWGQKVKKLPFFAIFWIFGTFGVKNGAKFSKSQKFPHHFFKYFYVDAIYEFIAFLGLNCRFV